MAMRAIRRPPGLSPDGSQDPPPDGRAESQGASHRNRLDTRLSIFTATKGGGNSAIAASPIIFFIAEGGNLSALSAQSKNPALLTTAQNIALAATSNPTDSHGILHDSCEPNCGSEGPQFKGIYVRNLASCMPP